MKKLTEFILFPRRNPRYEELKKHGTNDALRICVIVIPAVSLAMVLFLLMSIIWPESYGNAETLKAYRIGYLVLTLGMILFEAFMLFAKAHFDTMYQKVPVINSLVAVALLWWAVHMSRLDYVAFGYRVDPTTFIIISLSVPVCLYLDVRFYLTLTLVADALMVYLFLQNGVDEAFNKSNLGDFIVYMGVQLILGVVTFFYKSYMRENLLEQQEQQAEIRLLNQSQNRFFSNMSHEIRTPINTIIGLNEMILRQDASEEVHEDAENIKAASDMLLHLINDILDMSKFESGQMQLNQTTYSVADMLSEIVGMLSIRAKEKNLSFYVDVSPELPGELSGDEVRIKQILINVLNNAIKYTNEGQVRLSVQCEKDNESVARMVYSVSDTGMGIKKESMPYLFAAFKRVDEDKNKHIEGTGLGLSIVKQLIDLMGGRISVNSIYTKGSTFVIEIPQKIVDETPIGEIDMNNRHRSSQGQIYVKSFEAPEARVLVVDDTATNLMVVEKLLRATKVQIDTVESGQEALKRTLENTYHVILMDHLMPKMDGIECLHAIRNQAGGLCHESKVIALTANTGSNSRELYEKEGFDGYLMKPVTGDELEHCVYRYLPRDLVTVTASSRSLAEESVEWIRNHKKKAPIRVTVGSVADLPKVLQERYSIAVVPHIVLTDNGVFRDGIEIEPGGLLTYMQNPDVTVIGRPPYPEQYERFYSDQLDDANNIIHIALSSGVRSAADIKAADVAQDFGNVTVIDSGHLSSGIGLMAIEASRMAEDGSTVDEIVQRMEKMKSHVHTTFIVDSMEFLARQKHVSATVKRLADAFMVHPVIALKKGKMGVARVYFGTREYAWKRYIKSAFRVSGSIDKRILFITYVGMTKRDLDRVKEAVQEQIHFDEIFVQKASPSIAANCGPGTFGLLFFTKF